MGYRFDRLPHGEERGVQRRRVIDWSLLECGGTGAVEAVRGVVALALLLVVVVVVR